MDSISRFALAPRFTFTFLAVSLALAGCGIWPDFASRDGGIDAIVLTDGHADAAGDAALSDVPHDVGMDVSTMYGGFRMCTAPAASSTFAVTAVTGVPSAVRDLAFDNHGHFFVAADGVESIDMTGTPTSVTTSPTLMGGTAVRFLSDGRLGVTTVSGGMGTLSAVSLATGAVTVLSAPTTPMFLSPSSLAEHPTGVHFVSDTGANTIYRISADGTQISAILPPLVDGGPNLTAPTGLALTPDGRHLFYASPSEAAVFRIDLNADATVAGPETTYASGFLTGQGMAFDQCGYLYVSDRDRGRILRIAPNGIGAPEVLTLGALPFDAGTFAPAGVAFGQMGFGSTKLYVVDLGHSTVVAIDVGVPGAAVVTP